MKKSQKILIIIMAIVIAIIIGVIIWLRSISSQSYDDYEQEAYNDIKEVTNRETFYNIDNSINKYIKYAINNDTKAISSIEEKNANTNIIETVRKYSSVPKFYSQTMYSIDKVTNITAYVYGVIREKNTEDKYYLIVNLDYSNNTYTVKLSNEEEYNKAANDNTIDQQYLKTISISKNSYNEIDKTKVTDLDILESYFADYKFKAINSQEEAFNLLDSEYKTKKFNNDINKFKEYVKLNINQIQDSNIVKDGITKNGQYGEYIAIDNYNNYYKFIETAINEYTVILDNYTLESQELLSEYNKLSDQDKVTSNFDKIIKLINSKDYETLYNYLNKDFKTKNFSTLESFKTYMSKNFFDNNIIGTTTLKTEGTTYMITVPYKESLSSAAETRKKTFVIKLGSGTNFEFSFDI